MNTYQIETNSGGNIMIGINVSGRHGNRLFLKIDHTLNGRNGENEASILLRIDECKDVISLLNMYIKEQEGQDFVILADPIISQIESIPENETPKEI